MTSGFAGRAGRLLTTGNGDAAPLCGIMRAALARLLQPRPACFARCVAALLVLVSSSLHPPAMASIDVLALWDFARPEASEQRFRALLKEASPDQRAVLQTQIARSFGLRRRFDEARSELAPLRDQLPELGAEARVRYHLEYGRSFVSATHRREEKSPEARATARAAYRQAFELARSAGLDDLAIDALHMLPFVETDEASGLAWNQQALALVLQAGQGEVRRWESALRNNIGHSLHQLGRLEEALAMFESNIAVNERGGNVAKLRIAHWMVAWTLRALGRVGEALAVQLRLEKENDADGTPDPHVFDELTLLYQARGDASKAALYADRATLAKAARP